MFSLSEVEIRFLKSVSLVSGLTLFLYIARSALSGGLRVYSYVLINLALAWLPLIFAWLLSKELIVRRWLSWQAISLSILWLIFLPNAWYVLTDFIHIQTYGQASRIYDILMFSALSIAGLALGFASLYLVQQQIVKKIGRLRSYYWVTAVLALSSFAVYLGRELRWNTWDIIKDPVGLVLTVTDRLFSPLDYPGTISITLLFFIFLGTVYLALWFTINGNNKPPTTPKDVSFRKK